MAITLTSKAPGERVDYVWTPPIDAGDEISGLATVALVSGTANLDSATVEAGNQTVKLWFTLGTDGETSVFSGEVTTTGGRTWEETFYLPIAETAYSALAAKLVQVFPAFAAVPPATIEYWLEEAVIVANWGSDHAQLLLAAHYMAINGLGTGAVQGGLTSFKSGSVDMKFSEAQANAIGFAQTPYGQQFSLLLRRRHAGPRTISVGVASCPC